MGLRVDDSSQPYEIKTSTASSMESFFGGRKTNRLTIKDINSDIVKIAAKELTGNDPKKELDKFQNTGSYSPLKRTVTVSLGDKIYDINIRSCAKRLGLSNKEVFKLAKEGNLEGYLQALRESKIYDTLDKTFGKRSLLPKIANFIISNRVALTEKLSSGEIATYDIPNLESSRDHRLIIKDSKIFLSYKGIGFRPKELDLTSHFFDSKAPERLNSIAEQNFNQMHTRLKDCDVNANFSEHDLETIKDFVLVNQEKLLNKAKNSLGQNYFLRPSQTGLSRAIQVSSNGNVYVHFNMDKEGDKIIGKGSFKQFKFALHLNSGKLIAVGKTKLPTFTREREEVIAASQKESEFLNRFKDEPTIAKTIAQYQQTGKSEQKYVSLQPYYDSGDLKTSIDNESLTSKEKHSMILDMLKACSAISQKGVIHRDIKPANFFLTKDDDGNRKILMGDFGLATDFDDTVNKQNCCGTPLYMAPEIIKAANSFSPIDAISLSTTSKLDSWALGLTIYQMFGKEIPLDKRSFDHLYQHISRLTQDNINKFDFKGIPDEVQNLIKELLQVDPKKRLSAQDALQKYKQYLESNSK